MKIDLDALIQKRNACIDALDNTMTCENCKYNMLSADADPCKKCINKMLGCPLNPTEFKRSI